MVSYEAYESKLDEIGEAILNWSDKERNFRGYTEVRELAPEQERGRAHRTQDIRIGLGPGSIRHCGCIVASLLLLLLTFLSSQYGIVSRRLLANA